MSGWLCLLALPRTAAVPTRTAPPEIPAARLRDLAEYLKARWKTPEDFVLSEFPGLYKAGVRNLAIEFTCAEDQDLVDALLAAGACDENAVCRPRTQIEALAVSNYFRIPAARSKISWRAMPATSYMAKMFSSGVSGEMVWDAARI